MTPERVKPLQKKIDAGLKMRAAPTKHQKPVRACIGAVAIRPNYVPSRRNSRWPWGINSNSNSWVKVLSTIHPVIGTKHDSEGSCRDGNLNRIIVGNSVIPNKICLVCGSRSYIPRPVQCINGSNRQRRVGLDRGTSHNNLEGSDWDGIGSHGSFVPAPPDTHKRTSKYFVRTTQ